MRYTYKRYQARRLPSRAALDGLGPIIFIVATVLFSIYGRIRQSREEKKDKQQPLTRDQLPEKTRKMLYGDDVPTARRRQSTTTKPVQQPMQPRQAQPRQHPERPETLATIFEQLTGENIPTREAPQPPPLRQRQQAREETSARQAHLQRQQEAQQKKREATLRAAQQQQRSAQPRAQQQRRPEQQAAKAQQPRRRQRKRQQQPQPQRRRQPQPARQPQRTSLFGSPQDLRRAIVLSEILGPPKALR